MLPAQITAIDAVAAVMCVLAQRLSGGEAMPLVEVMPRSLQAMLRPCALHLEKPEIFDREEFFARVSRRINVDRRAAEEITKGVFAAIKNQLPAQEVRHVLSQLPKELEELWAAFAPV